MVDGTVFGNDGRVVNPETLTRLGSFGSGVLEIESFSGDGISIPEGGATYTIGLRELTLFSNETFQEIASVDLGFVSSTPADLFFAGDGTLGLIRNDGSLSLITGVPTSSSTSVPEPSSSILMFAVGLGLSCRRGKRSRRSGV